MKGGVRVKGDNITEKAKEIRREYQRNYMRGYRKRNPEKIRDINQKYWINVAKKQSTNETEEVK